jgi:hypothetical protein
MKNKTIIHEAIRLTPAERNAVDVGESLNESLTRSATLVGAV